MGSSPVCFPPNMGFNPQLPFDLPQSSCDMTAFRHHHHRDGCGQNSGQNWFSPFGGPGQDGSPWGGFGGYGDDCGGQGGARWPGSNGDGCGCGSGELSVNSSNNTVTDGQYVIKATDDNSGTLTVTDTQTGKSFKVWGDPHISTDQGGTADFQHEPVTFKLPDGTEITVTPTNNTGANSVNTIDNVTITKGNDAVTMTGFKNGHLTTQDHEGQGYSYDETTDHGTLIRVGGDGNADQLTLPDGTKITNNNVGNIDHFGDSSSQSGGTQGCGSPSGRGPEIRMLMREINQLEQLIGQLEQGLFGNPYGGGLMPQY
jgi:Domain of Unknown Function (DUF1521)